MRFTVITAVFLLNGIAQSAAPQEPKPEPATKAEKKAGDLPVGKPGPGMVWVDSETKTYYRSNHPLYGKTKKGTYMSEGDAVNDGFHDPTIKPAKKPETRQPTR
jgi:hypothetical protein